MSVHPGPNTQTFPCGDDQFPVTAHVPLVEKYWTELENELYARMPAP